MGFRRLHYKKVVTSFLQAGEKVLLLRRSGKVGTYQGRWAAVSGFLEADEDPVQRARIEIHEEVGLDSNYVRLIRSGEPLRAFDEQGETVWIVHPFLFEVSEPNIRLDWEHVEYRWIDPKDLSSYETVPKLKESFDRVRWDLQAYPPALSNVLRLIGEIAQDRVHGATFLGQRSLEAIRETIKTSTATSPDRLFRDILLVALRLRKAQPSMATITNLVGKLLNSIERERGSSSSTEQFRKRAVSLVDDALANAQAASEDAARNSVAILPAEGHVLTHSYSSTVKRALELGMNSGRSLMVFVTESHPGLEGKQLAKDLINIGLTVKLVADSAVTSILSDVDLVLVGADSVLADGSLVNKVGTGNIAELAKARGIPVFVICETAKFSTVDFLGEAVQASGLFDLTPRDYISKFITEIGPIEPMKVERQIMRMVREVYP